MRRNSIFLTTLLLCSIFSFSGCQEDKLEKCKEDISGSWKSFYLSSPYPNEDAILLRLDAGSTGRISFEYEDGSEDSFDIEFWSVNEDCNNLEFEDEDGDDANLNISGLDDKELRLTGKIYGDKYVIHFRRR